jgi:hypothetical protein
MKYLKVFEGFESLKLSKVFRYIKKDYRKRFSDDLRIICKDYPISELSDDKFQYLRFSDAYKLRDTDEKRYLKFWFSLDGSYIGITKFKLDSRDSVLKSFNISALPVPINKLKHLQKVYGRLNWGSVISTIWVEPDRVCAIHGDRDADGSAPNAPRSEWSKYGPYSWTLSGEKLYTLEPKGEGEEVDERPPEVFNISVNNNLSPTGLQIKDYLKNADFALILDLNALTQDVPKNNVSKTKYEREIRKSGKKTSDQIKKENIDRYLSKLSDFKKEKGIGQVKNIIPRLFGWDHPLFFVYWKSIDDYLADIISYIYRLIKRKDEAYLQHISTRVKEGYNFTSSRYRIISDNVKKCREKATKENNQEVLNFLDRYDRLNKAIKEALYKREVSTISDLESLEQRVKLIRSLIKNSRNSLPFGSFLEYLDRNDYLRSYGYIYLDANSLHDIDEAIDAILNL